MSQPTDWVSLLRHQQQDFITRLESGHLISSSVSGCHSESVIISGERLKALREFCWEMAEKYKRGSKVKKTFINNLKGKLGEEIVKGCLGDFITEVDYQLKIGGDGKVDFTLSSDTSKGIQVKTRTFKKGGEITWTVSLDEIQKNEAVVCILIEEEIDEAQAEYHLIFAGFLPSKLITERQEDYQLKISELLYASGLKWFLENAESVKVLIEEAQEASEETAISPSSEIISFGIGPVEVFPRQNEILLKDQGLKLSLSSVILHDKDSCFPGKEDDYHSQKESAICLGALNKFSFLKEEEKALIQENMRFILQGVESKKLLALVEWSGVSESPLFLSQNANPKKLIEEMKNVFNAVESSVYVYSITSKKGVIEKLIKSKKDVKSERDLFFGVIDRSPGREEIQKIWQSVIGVLEPLGTRALLLQQGRLIALDQQEDVAFIEIQSRLFIKMILGRADNVTSAFKISCGKEVKPIFVTFTPLSERITSPPIPPPPPHYCYD